MAMEEGLVVGISDDGQAQVVTQRKSACADCSSSHCCMSLGSSSKMMIKAMNRAGAKAGDLVSITLKSQTLIKSAAIAYMIPFAGLISGVIAGVYLSQRWSISEDSASMILGIVGLLLGVGIASLIYKSVSAGTRLTPVITRIIQQGVKTPQSFMATDPVCKMMVDPAQSPESLIYEDKTYYFCTPNCKETFVKDPKRYIYQ